MMTTALLLLLACQDSEYVQKLDKVKYNLATRNCREAERRLDSDETGAIERLTRIIDDPDLTKKECLLFVQQTDQYDPAYAFLPYQYRARARLSLAGKARSDAEKKRLLEDAVADLEESVKRNVKSSSAYLDTAKGELKKLADAGGTPPAANPVSALRARQAPLIAENRFTSARALVEKEGAALSAADRADLYARADVACRNYLTEELRRFRGRLQRIAVLSEFRALTKDEFDLTFELPSPAEIPVAHPAYDWARRSREIYREVWAGRKPGSSLLSAAQDAAKLEEGGDNPWLKLTGTLAFQDLRTDVERRIAECADAPRAKREILAEEIQARVTTWTAFADRLDPEVRKRATWIDEQSKSLRDLAARQPRELAELDREDLKSCFEKFPVEPELQSLEGRLRQVEAAGGLTVEARQKLYTLLVAARAVRLFLEGKAEAEVLRAVQADLQNLGRVGGAVDPDRFGPRIRKVYDSLR